jgi:hypothetical protein
MRYFFLILLPLLLSCNQEKPGASAYTAPASTGKEKSATPKENVGLQEGDLIFQSTSGGQGRAIQIATGSPYSHVGIVFKRGEELMVYEAVQPVKVTPLKQFIARGDNDHFVVKRLKKRDELLSKKELAAMKKAGDKHLGKDYDLYFEWSDKKMYCSELVWKIYKEGAGIHIGKLQKLKDFNLNNPIVQYKLKERYGRNIPYEEEVISPAAIFDSELLEEIAIK